MTLSAAAHEYLLAFADDEHCVGARHTAWIGLGPFLEEDLAFCSIAQDELGHAIALYEIILDGSTVGLDDFALRRDPADYRSCWLAEAECSDWDDSLVRHWLYDRAEALRWQTLESCADDRLVALAARAQREESFHLDHAEQLMSRLAGSDAAGQLIEATERLLPLARALWTPVDSEAAAIDEGFIERSSNELSVDWDEQIRHDLSRWGLDVAIPSAEQAEPGAARQLGRRQRSDAFAQLHADIGRVIAEDPAATW